MSERAVSSEQPPSGWRLKMGAALFVLSVSIPVIGVPAAAALSLSAAMTATVSGVLLMAGEVLGVTAVAVMGKSGYVFIKTQVFRILRRYGPPEEVSRIRYTIGLVMFTVPILFGWASVYAVELIPGFTRTPILYAIGGDLLLVASLFVLGGNFWDKIRALFVHDAEVRFSHG